MIMANLLVMKRHQLLVSAVFAVLRCWVTGPEFGDALSREAEWFVRDVYPPSLCRLGALKACLNCLFAIV